MARAESRTIGRQPATRSRAEPKFSRKRHVGSPQPSRIPAQCGCPDFRLVIPESPHNVGVQISVIDKLELRLPRWGPAGNLLARQGPVRATAPVKNGQTVEQIMQPADLHRRTLLGAAGLVAAEAVISKCRGATTSPISAAPTDRLRIGPLRAVADLLSLVPTWTTSVLSVQPPWEGALQTAALMQLLNPDDARTAIAIAADRDNSAALPPFISDARTLFALDLVFECRDDDAKICRRYIESFAQEAAVPPGCELRTDMSSVLCWRPDSPQFARALKTGGIGTSGSTPSLLHEFDRRVRLGCPFRGGLPDIVTVTGRAALGHPAKSLPGLIAGLKRIHFPNPTLSPPTLPS